MGPIFGPAMVCCPVEADQKNLLITLFITRDAPIEGGMSGSPIIRYDGKAIGLIGTKQKSSAKILPGVFLYIPPG